MGNCLFGKGSFIAECRGYGLQTTILYVWVNLEVRIVQLFRKIKVMLTKTT